MTYANPDALVTTDWLKANLSDPNLRVIEVDEDATVYDKDHIPGAIAWSWSARMPITLNWPIRSVVR